jgi:anti-sigma B factor antagonist
MVHIRRLQEEGADIIHVIGEIDASSSIELDLTIAKSVGEGHRKILIDCHALEYISSAGLGVFMSYIDEFKGSCSVCRSVLPIPSRFWDWPTF